MGLAEKQSAPADESASLMKEEKTPSEGEIGKGIFCKTNRSEMH